MSKEIRRKMALRLKQLRKKCGYTQEKLSELSGIDYKHIQQLEGKNPSGATIDTLEKLASAFRISPSKLLDFK